MGLNGIYLKGFTESAELSNIPVTDTAQATDANTSFYAFYTVPTTYKFIIITGIEWKNGTVVDGTIQSGIEIINTDPPTIDNSMLVALGNQVTQTGTSVVQRTDINFSMPIRGGTVIGAWVNNSSATGTLRYAVGASQVQYKLITHTANPTIQNTTAWATATTSRAYIKIYYRGYS